DGLARLRLQGGDQRGGEVAGDVAGVHLALQADEYGAVGAVHGGPGHRQAGERAGNKDIADLLPLLGTLVTTGGSSGHDGQPKSSGRPISATRPRRTARVRRDPLPSAATAP